MRIALVQSDLYWEDVSANLSQFEEKIWKIEEAIDVIVLPEMFSTGFSMNTNVLAEPMNLTTHKWMKQMANQTNAAICGSFVVKINEFLFNRLLWVQPDGVSHFYDKRHLFTYGGEQNFYKAGLQRLIIEWRGWKFCPLICYDLRFPVWSRNTKLDLYDCLIYVANWPQKRATAWNTLLKARAIENLSYSVGVNRIGNDGNGVYHSGDSSAYDFKGYQMVHCADKENVLLIELDKDQLIHFRNEFPALEDADEFRFV
jgi:omega-amidase